jgi:NAD(P)-dependent dehydrogenase (short-subunit alcohol dehydrogenase family)
MKVVVIGATGTIGRAVADACARRGHEVIRTSRSSEPRVDIEDLGSIRALFRQVRGIAAVVSCAGHGIWKSLANLTDADLETSIKNKLLGQVNVIRIAMDQVTEGGSVTVTSGMLATRPIPGSAALSLANGGLDGFVRAAALEAPRGVRINVVSPSCG